MVTAHWFTATATAILLTISAAPVLGQPESDLPGDGEAEEEELAKAAQNPVGDLISLPVISQPAPGSDRTNGLGDLNFTGFISPSKPGKVIWGVGPAFIFPTATDNVLGTDKWSAGPSVVVLTMPDHVLDLRVRTSFRMRDPEDPF